MKRCRFSRHCLCLTTAHEENAPPLDWPLGPCVVGARLRWRRWWRQFRWWQCWRRQPRRALRRSWWLGRRRRDDQPVVNRSGQFAATDCGRRAAARDQQRLASASNHVDAASGPHRLSRVERDWYARSWSKRHVRPVDVGARLRISRSPQPRRRQIPRPGACRSRVRRSSSARSWLLAVGSLAEISCSDAVAFRALFQR